MGFLLPVSYVFKRKRSFAKKQLPKAGYRSALLHIKYKVVIFFKIKVIALAITFIFFIVAK